MDTEVLVGIIGLAGSAVGSLGGILINTKLSNYRIEQLEKKVDKHNNLIERTYQIEKDIEVIKNDIKVANHRIDDLEDEDS